MADKKISALTGASTPLAGTEVLPIVQGGSTVKVSIADVTAGRDVAMQSLDVSLPFYDPNGRPRVRTAVSGADPVLEWDRWSGVGTNFNGARFIYDGTDFSFGNAPTGAVGSLSFTNRLQIGATGDVKANTGNLVIGTAAKGIDFSANANAPGMTSELLDWYEEGTWTGTLTASTPPTTPITKTGRYTRIGNQVTVAIEFDNVDTSGASGTMEVTGLPFAAVSAGYGPVMKSGLGTQVSTAGIYGGLSKVIFSDAGTMNNTPIVAAAGVYLRFSATYFV